MWPAPVQRITTTNIARLFKSGTLGLAIKGELGQCLSYLGEKIERESLIYNPWTYAIFHRLALEVAPIMVSGILKLFPAIKTVGDFGCGTGVYINEFRKCGLTAEGFEYSDTARKIAYKSFGLALHPFNLQKFPQRGNRFDLCISIEVAEHLVPECGDKLIEVVCEHAPLVIFTAAHPGQPGQGHIHLQPRSYWVKRFARHGFQLNETQTALLATYLRANLYRGLFIADNLGIYEKRCHGASI